MVDDTVCFAPFAFASTLSIYCISREVPLPWQPMLDMATIRHLSGAGE